VIEITPVVADRTTGAVAVVATVPEVFGQRIAGVPVTACALTVTVPLVWPVIISDPSAAAEFVRVSDPAVVPAIPKVGVAVQLEAEDEVVFGTCPAAADVALVPPPAMGMVGRSPVAMAEAV
jgi:hypothetical protein